MDHVQCSYHVLIFQMRKLRVRKYNKQVKDYKARVPLNVFHSEKWHLLFFN